MEKKDVRMVYCPTEEMVADYSTKPTQGSLFVYQRDLILGIKKEEFGIYKSWYKEVLLKYDIWDDKEKDLESLWLQYEVYRVFYVKSLIVEVYRIFYVKSLMVS